MDRRSEKVGEGEQARSDRRGQPCAPGQCAFGPPDEHGAVVLADGRVVDSMDDPTAERIIDSMKSLGD